MDQGRKALILEPDFCHVYRLVCAHEQGWLTSMWQDSAVQFHMYL